MFDMKNLSQLKRLDENAPDAMKAFWAFDKAAFTAGALDAQQKQLMAVAVALTTQCPYCIELHVKAAREAGATDQMLAETATVAAAMRAGAAITHATHLFQELKRVGVSLALQRGGTAETKADPPPLAKDDNLGRLGRLGRFGEG